MYVKFDIGFMKYLNPHYLNSLEQCGLNRRDLMSVAIQTVLNMQLSKTVNMNTRLYQIMLIEDEFKEIVFDLAPNVIREQMFKPLVDILSIICSRLEPSIRTALNGGQRPVWYAGLCFNIVELTESDILLNFYIPLPLHERVY